MKKIIMVIMLSANFLSAKPLCVIFTSGGGGGHRSADDMASRAIADEYDVELAFLMRDVLAPIDPVRFLSFNTYCSEDLYNFLLGKRWYRLTNILGGFGTWSTSWLQGSIERHIEAYVRKHNPQFIISVIPLCNGPILSVAQKLNIPCLIIPTDLDSAFFMHGVDHRDYTRWRYIVPFDDEDILGPIKELLPRERMIFGGFPIRKTFFEEKDKSVLKKEFGLPEDKPIIMLLMGAQGSNGCYDCLKSIMQLKNPVHVIVCLGKNGNLIHRINKLHFPGHITCSFVGFTDRIADYMAVSDILISKSGTVSVCEALYSGLPMILDQTSKVPTWEQFNHSFIVKHDYGDTFDNYKNLGSILEQYLDQEGYCVRKKQALATFTRTNLGADLLRYMRELEALSC